MGSVTFWGNDDGTPTAQQYAGILAEIHDATSDEESGKLTLQVASHDGGVESGLILTGGSADAEVDVTLGAGAASIVTIPGGITIGNVEGTDGSDAAISTVGLTFLVADGGDGTAYSLADGTVIGQVKQMRFVQQLAAHKYAVVTAATGGWGGSSTVSFHDIGDFASLVWANLGSGAKWYPHIISCTSGSAGLG